MDHITNFTLPGGGPSFDMVRVPGGKFIMGSPKDESERSDDETQHPASVSDFMLGKYVVTQELWQAVLGLKPSHFKGEQLPVEQVSWFDATVFCNALNVLLGKQPCYMQASPLQPFGWEVAKKRWNLPNKGAVVCDFKANGFRLPTEAEWEYAARGGPFAPSLQSPQLPDYRYAGSDQLEQVGWFEGNSGGQTREVGLLLPNALGLYDMSGNVFEWCHDWYAEYKKTPPPDYIGAETGALRVLRGGYWYFSPLHCRVAYRFSLGPDFRNGSIGLRLALQ